MTQNLILTINPGTTTMRCGLYERDGAGVKPVREDTIEHDEKVMAGFASIADQFIPVQRALDDSDALNEWTTAIGSAVFAVPPGYAKGGWVGETLLG